MPSFRRWDPAPGDWVDFHGTFGEWMDAIPFSSEEAEAFTKAGILPVWLVRMLKK